MNLKFSDTWLKHKIFYGRTEPISGKPFLISYVRLFEQHKSLQKYFNLYYLDSVDPTSLQHIYKCMIPYLYPRLRTNIFRHVARDKTHHFHILIVWSGIPRTSLVNKKSCVLIFPIFGYSSFSFGYPWFIFGLQYSIPKVNIGYSWIESWISQHRMNIHKLEMNIKTASQRLLLASCQKVIASLQNFDKKKRSVGFDILFQFWMLTNKCCQC